MRATRGLTLVELVVALAISGLIMAAVCRTVLHLTRANAVNASRFRAQTLDSGLRRLLVQDFAHARAWRPAPHGFQLIANAELDPQGLQLLHGTVEVTYELRGEGPASRLLRIQRKGQTTLTELVASGVVALTSGLTADTLGPADRWRPMPAVVTLGVGFRDEDLGTRLFTIQTGSQP